MNEYIHFAESKIRFSDHGEKEEAICAKAAHTIRTYAQSSMAKWYFESEQPWDLFAHSARVTYLMTLLCQFLPKQIPEQAFEKLVIASIIHELVGDPSKSSSACVSAETLDYIESNNLPSISGITGIIEQQDERCDGSGFPKGLTGDKISLLPKVFAIPNAYDHLLLETPGGSLRFRNQKVKKILRANSKHFDRVLFELFFPILERLRIST